MIICVLDLNAKLLGIDLFIFVSLNNYIDLFFNACSKNKLNFKIHNQLKSSDLIV